jgi:hypothetical protein
MAQPSEARPLSVCLSEVDTTDGRKRVYSYVASRPFPHFEATDVWGLLVRVDADDTRTRGRFVNRQFWPVEPK